MRGRGRRGVRKERRNRGGRLRWGERGWRGLMRVWWEEGVVREECRHKTLMRKAYNAHFKLSPSEQRSDFGEAVQTLKT